MSQQTPGSTTTQAPQGDAFENLSQENRKFAPSPEFAANAVVTAADYAEADADRPAFWAKQARELLTWSKDFTPDPGLVHAALRQVVRRGRDQRRLQRAGPPRRGRPRGPRRHLLRGRTGRYPHLHVRPAHRGGQEGRQRLRVPRRRQGRPGGRVPADDSRGRHHAAGLRPDRRHPLGGLRRFLRRGAALPDRRRRSQARGHRRRHLPARQAQCAQARRRRGVVPRGGRQRPHRAERRRRQAQRPERRLARGPRPLVGRHGRDRLRRAHRRRA